MGVSPQNPVEDEEAKAKFAQLSGAIKLNQLQYQDTSLISAFRVLRTEVYEPTYNTQVTAVALRQYADRKNNVPRFLENVQLPRAEPPQLPKPQQNNAD